MYRLAFIIVVILAIAAGLLIGTLNADAVSLDLLWVQLTWPLGLITIAALSLGVLLGMLATWCFQVLPARMALRRQRLNSVPPSVPDIETSGPGDD